MSRRTVANEHGAKGTCGVEPAMNELPDILNAALISPKEIRFATPVEARSWVYRAHNFIRRHNPSMRQLMITRRGTLVNVRVPQMEVRDAT